MIIKKRNGHEVFPKINLNAETGECSISGDSYMQDTKKFFQPVLDWFENFIKSDSSIIVLNCRLNSFNTGTSRVLFLILEKLRAFKDQGGEVEIKWFYEDYKDTLADDIVDIISEFGININLVSVE